jgi:hypothetical protein
MGCSKGIRNSIPQPPLSFSPTGTGATAVKLLGLAEVWSQYFLSMTEVCFRILDRWGTIRLLIVLRLFLLSISKLVFSSVT